MAQPIGQADAQIYEVNQISVEKKKKGKTQGLPVTDGLHGHTVTKDRAVTVPAEASEGESFC